MMYANEFKDFLYDNIPITKAMELSVLEFNDTKIKVAAKLKANKNHKETAFGGSISSLAIVCGWSLVYANIKPVDSEAHIVIQKSSINYLRPIDKDFTAECILDSEEIKRNFIDTYYRHNKSRIKLKILCYCGETLAAEMEGQYVVFK